MYQKLSIRLALAALLLVPLGLAAAQGPTSSSSIQAQAQVPRTIRISGELNDLGASTVPSLETIRFTLVQALREQLGALLETMPSGQDLPAFRAATGLLNDSG